MSYVVTVPLAIIRMSDGTLVHLYEGAIVPKDADPEHVETLLRDKAIGDPDKADDDSDDASAGGRQPTPDKPAGNSSYDAWAAYAVNSGQATDEDVKGMTRDELRELYG
jgi:hypothetical protein